MIVCFARDVKPLLQSFYFCLLNPTHPTQWTVKDLLRFPKSVEEVLHCLWSAHHLILCIRLTIFGEPVAVPHALIGKKRMLSVSVYTYH